MSHGTPPPLCTWVKPGRFGSFFVLCFVALRGHCLQMLCLPGFGTQANTQNFPHFRAFPASTQEHSPPKCLFFMANAKLPNHPGFALLHPPALGKGEAVRKCLRIRCAEAAPTSALTLKTISALTILGGFVSFLSPSHLEPIPPADQNSLRK